MASVYSYARLSTPGQRHGHGAERQKSKAELWLEGKGHTLVESYLDLKSGFRGSHKHRGNLAKFLAKIGKDIEPDSILLVENLDRLSREEMDEAEELFKKIIRAGIRIAVIEPTERIYDRETLKSPFTLMEPLMAFYLNHQESLKRSVRTKDNWKQKREKGGKYHVKVPTWISRVNPQKLKDKDGNRLKYHDPQAEKFELNENAKIVKFIFQRTADGLGQRKILGELQEKFKAFGSSGKWNGSFLAALLSDRSVIGEYQPKKADDDGKRVVAGPVVKNYYPAAIPMNLWNRAQAARDKRRKIKGPATKFVNLFTGLLFSAHDGSPMYTQQTGHAKRRLVSRDWLNMAKGADPLSVDYEEFTSACLRFIGQLDVAVLDTQSDFTAIKHKEQELEGIQLRIAQLQAALADPAEDFTELRQAMKDAKANLAICEKQLIVLRRNQTSMDQPLEELKTIKPDTNENRERIRLALHDSVARITIKSEKHHGRIYATVLVEFRNGLHRPFVIGPELHHAPAVVGPVANGGKGLFGFNVNTNAGNAPGERMHKMRIECTREQFADPKHMLLATFAQRLSKSAVPIEVNDVPDTLGEAAKVFMRFRAGEMAAESFRVVPSKIKRFVNSLGADLPCANINEARWNKFMKELKAEGLAVGTERITWQRAHELVRWLVFHKKCEAIEAKLPTRSSASEVVPRAKN